NAKTAAQDPQAEFEKLAINIASIQDPILRVKIATEALGRSGADQIATFIALKERGEEVKQRMAELRLGLSGSVTKGASRVDQEFAILGAVAEATTVKVANQLAPQLVTGLRAIEEALTKLVPVIVYVGQKLFEQLSPVLSLLIKVADVADA